MKRFSNIVILMLLIGLSAACSQDKARQRINNATRGERPGNNGGAGTQINPNQACGTESWGKFFSASSNDAEFQNNARLFGSTSVPFEEIGTISGNPTDTNTGIWFCGNIGLNGVSIRNLSNQPATIAAASMMKALIIDSFVREQNGLPAIEATFFGQTPQGGSGHYRVEGSVTSLGSALKATVTFSDPYGTVTLDGNINAGPAGVQGSTFEGNVSFSNTCTITRDESGGLQCTPKTTGPVALGKFSIPTCSFFNCN